MKRMLMCLACAGAMLLGGLDAAFAVTYDELAAGETDFRAGKISKEEYLAYLGGVIGDASNGSRVRAAALAMRGGVYLYYEKDLEKSKVDVEASLATDDTVPGGYSMKADILYKQKRYKEAAENYTKAAERSVYEDTKILRQDFALISNSLVNTQAAAAFFQECSDNPFAAEEKYGNSLIAIKGKIDKIGRSMNGMPEITFTVASFKEIECELLENQKANVAKIRKGEETVLVCFLKKAGNAVVNMKGCLLILE